MTVIYSVPFQGAIKLIHSFQDRAGMDSHAQAVKAMLALNRAIISDGHSRLKYKLSEDSQTTITPRDLYEGNLETLRSTPRGQRDVMRDLQGVDPVHVSEIMDYMTREEIKVRSCSEALTVAFMVAKAMYDHFGDDKTGEMHIPALYPGRLDNGRQRHIYLKP